MAEPYSYLHLSSHNSTRILVLSPARADEALRGRLVEINLESPSSYVALSYTWGAASLSEPLEIDGKLLFITPSADTALRRLRSRKSTLSIWIDAICINQQDIDERSAQVKNMGVIYKQATAVIVWLGSGTREEDLAWKRLRFVSLFQPILNKSSKLNKRLVNSVWRGMSALGVAASKLWETYADD